MDEWACMRSGISSTEQVLRANIRHLKEQLMIDPNCNLESILITLALLEETILALNDARS
jgi:hypothetical protein